MEKSTRVINNTRIKLTATNHTDLSVLFAVSSREDALNHEDAKGAMSDATKGRLVVIEENLSQELIDDVIAPRGPTVCPTEVVTHEGETEDDGRGLQIARDRNEVRTKKTDTRAGENGKNEMMSQDTQTFTSPQCTKEKIDTVKYVIILLNLGERDDLWRDAMQHERLTQLEGESLYSTTRNFVKFRNLFAILKFFCNYSTTNSTGNSSFYAHGQLQLIKQVTYHKILAYVKLEKAHSKTYDDYIVRATRKKTRHCYMHHSIVTPPQDCTTLWALGEIAHHETRTTGVRVPTTTEMRKLLVDGKFEGFIKSKRYDTTYEVSVTREKTYYDGEMFYNLARFYGTRTSILVVLVFDDTEFKWLIKDKEYGVNYLAISQYVKARIVKLNALIVSRKMMYCEFALEEKLHSQGNTRSGPITYVYDHKRKGSGEYIELERELRDRSEDIINIVGRRTELGHELRDRSDDLVDLVERSIELERELSDRSIRDHTGFEGTLRECPIADDTSIF